MALQVTALERKFVLKKNGKDVALSDPNPDFSPAEVMSFYSAMYPELTTATLHGPNITLKGVEYELKTSVGVKG